MCETVQESSQAFSTDKHLEEGGIARGNELLVLEHSVQDAAGANICFFCFCFGLYCQEWRVPEIQGETVKLKTKSPLSFRIRHGPCKPKVGDF